jgi:hypothetical protein
MLVCRPPIRHSSVHVSEGFQEESELRYRFKCNNGLCWRLVSVRLFKVQGNQRMGFASFISRRCSIPYQQSGREIFDWPYRTTQVSLPSWPMKPLLSRTLAVTLISPAFVPSSLVFLSTSFWCYDTQLLQERGQSPCALFAVTETCLYASRLPSDTPDIFEPKCIHSSFGWPDQPCRPVYATLPFFRSLGKLQFDASGWPGIR